MEEVFFIMLMVMFTLEILKMIKCMDKELTNTKMDQNMKENFRMIKNTVMERYST